VPVEGKTELARLGRFVLVVRIGEGVGLLGLMGVERRGKASK